MSAPLCGTWPAHKSFEITNSTIFTLLTSDAFLGVTQAQEEIMQSTFLQNNDALDFLSQVQVLYPEFPITK